MAESNQEPMSMEAFRAKKAAVSTLDKPTASSSRKMLNPSGSSSNSAQARPSSASRTNSSKRSASAENLSGGDRYGPAMDKRQNKVKLLREKQADERRRKNEERRAAFEERKKKKEEEEKERWAALKEQASSHSIPKGSTSAMKPGSGRKLPTVPSEGAAKRPGSAVESPSRPSSLPRPLNRPVSANLSKSPSRHSADSLSAGSTPKQSPASTPSGLQLKTSLAGNKSVSAGNLNSAAARRPASGSSQPRPSSGVKSRPRTSSHTSSQTLEKPRSRNSLSHETLLLPGGKLTKSHSTSSLHRVGHHKPAGDKNQKTEKAETKPKAGVTDEATAKQALAERRKKAREEAERQAALDRERQEAERLKREEEERIRAEEEAKEEARMRELAELLRKQEEERLRIAAEEKERKDREEAEQAAAEKKRKEEEEQRVKEEEERKALEDEERRKQEEAERLERKRRVEQIMSRTRQTASPTTTEDAKERADPDDTKRKVNEILQKVKGVSGSTNTLSQLDNHGTMLVAENCEEQENRDKSTIQDTVNHSSEDLELMGFDAPDNSLDRLDADDIHMNGINSTVLDSDKDSSSGNMLSSSPPLIVGPEESSNVVISSNSTNYELLKETVLPQDKEEAPVTINTESCIYSENGTDKGLETENVSNGEVIVRHLPETSPDLTKGDLEGVSEDLVGNGDEEEALWLKVESTMKAREQYAIETLENLGVVAEGDDDEHSEEGQLWKVVEGKAKLAEVS